MKTQQRGNVIVGIIIGVVLGLAAALAVAVYVTKVPVPFLNKGQSRTAEQDAAEMRKNRDWDPNAPLYGKNPAKPLAPAPGVPAPAPTVVTPGAVAPAVPVATIPGPGSSPAASAPARAASIARAASAPAPQAKSADPLGDLAASRTAVAGGDPFFYFVQAGAFRTAEDAEAQRAKLSLMGIEAKVTEREQAGRQVFRVRVGPYDRKEDADRQKEKLESGGVETALVRVQR
ncbi:SPOR domain-containing protein [Caenimonas aquaedulcis]|uniref:SPOR domain-containing protein n=1 Tax=Caenimonas aquaedulcis TaxID=2793270 RepID=A0A931H5Z7_9BURK|nr:SPOR domain-containing protein [Caenimonas aquaedulcis]